MYDSIYTTIYSTPVHIIGIIIGAIIIVSGIILVWKLVLALIKYIDASTSKKL